MSPKHAGKYVAYYRVSTQKQGESGLGLEAQQAAVRAYLNGGPWQLLGEFIEVESGKRSDNRPQLEAAMALCRRHRATLLIAKLDRLSRNLAFIATLMEAGVAFIAVDNPHANKLTVHLLAAVAEHERDLISERTKAAMAAARARGVKLGAPPEARERARQEGVRRIVEQADKYAHDVVMPVIEKVQASGITTLSGIARELAARNIRTRRGGMWTACAVRNVLMRGAA
jgi:DNA invertase Pin-like site-specific DNA recombinase